MWIQVQSYPVIGQIFRTFDKFTNLLDTTLNQKLFQINFCSITFFCNLHISKKKTIMIENIYYYLDSGNIYPYGFFSSQFQVQP